MRPRPSNQVVALRVIGAAAVGIFTTCASGLALHNYTMDAANDHERKLAARVGWNLAESKLYCFDESHPNNRGREEDIRLMRIKLEERNAQMDLDEKEGRLKRFNLKSKQKA